jgi:GNAT superfamily N-acetyltransferase
MVTDRRDIAIRQLSRDDVDGALRLSSTAGWNQRLEDWQMLLTIAPAGSFGAVDESAGLIVGTAIGIDYGSFGWIAMMLVDPAYRSRGLGAGLLEAAMSAVPDGKPIRLDATPMGRPLYQRYGFRDESMLTRHVAGARDRQSFAGGSSARAAVGVRPLEPADLEDIARHDRDTFGGDRAAVLEWARHGAPQYARLIRRGVEPPQYCFGRSGRLFDQIGPIVAHRADAATALLSAAIVSAGDRPVVVDSFDANGDFTEWLRGCGFSAERPLYRMCRPAGTSAVDALRRRQAGEFAIFGPEFA